MALLALLALVASVMIWAAPGSEAQSNQAPFADAGPDQTVNPGVTVTLNGTASVDVDGTGGTCGGCTYKWVVEAGPYDWVDIASDTTAAPTFLVPSEAFVDKVRDDDPHKYEIVVRLTVTDDKGATDSDTVSININRRPVADIQVYAGLRDRSVTDADLGAKGHFPLDAVIDGPGENGNRDNEWDVKEGAYLQLDGSASTDESPTTGRPSSYLWTLVQPASTPTGYQGSQTAASATAQRLDVAVSGASNTTTITFAGVDEDNDGSDDTLVVYTLPNVAPNAPQTVFYQLTVCDSSPASTGNIYADPANCSGGRTGSSLVRITVHDTSSDPVVRVSAELTAASETRGDDAPQATVGQLTGVENQFIVDAGSTVLLTASVYDSDQPSGTAHSYRWTGASAETDRSTATASVPAGAADGDTVDVSVTVTDSTRNTVTVPIQLLVGDNTEPTAGGVPANKGSIDGPSGPVLWVHEVTDGFQNKKDGSTLMLRGVGNDADGDSLVTAWAVREAPTPLVEASAWDGAANSFGCNANAGGGDSDTLDTIADPNGTLREAIKAWIDAPGAGTAGLALAAASCVLSNMVEPAKPLFELENALTDEVSFDVPNLESSVLVDSGATPSVAAENNDDGALLVFSVIDSNGVASAQIVYVYVKAEDDPPSAKAGPDQQVDPGSFVRLNGSASSDPDVGDKVSYKWEYTGATMDPAPDARSPLSAAEIDELDGWILTKKTGGFDYIVNARGELTGTSDKLKSTATAYPYFDAPKLTGFNNVRLTFKLHVKDSPGTDLDGDDNTENGNVASLSEVALQKDLDGDGDMTNTSVATVNEADLGLDLNNDGDAEDTINLGVSTCGANGSLSCAADEAEVAAVASDTVTVTVANRYYSGLITGPNFCVAKSLGGPQTHPFDADGDGVAETCSLNTTRRATVARQNALETIATLNPAEFRTAVLAECDKTGFKQKNYGDDPDDLEGDVCATERVAPPPAGVDPAIVDVFFTGAIDGPDFCANHSLGGARTYAMDSDGDDVADTCSLSTTQREAIARQNALETFIVSGTFSAADQTGLDERERLYALGVKVASRTSLEIDEYADLYQKYVDATASDTYDTDLTDTQKDTVGAEIVALRAKKETAAKADRYTNALAASCQALGSQDFGDAASALARDACAPKPNTGDSLPD